MCIGAVLLGAVLLAGCSWAAIGALEKGLNGWRALGLMLCALGGVLGVTSVFGGFHAHGGTGPVAAVSGPVVVVIEVQGRAAG